MEALNPGLPTTIVDAVTSTGAKGIYALPARPCLLTWQTSFDVAPSAFNATLRVSIDGVTFTVLDTTTNVNGETRTIAAPTSAVFVQVNVVTNTGTKALTVSLIAKAIY